MGAKGFATYKQRGEWVELLFMTRAVERGFNALKPWGDSARYDVSIEHNGRFLRVQVKCTETWIGSAYRCTLVAAHQRPYTAADLDYFAIYIVPDDIWYFFPVRVLEGQSAVVLTPHRKGHKHEKYKQAWDLLESRSQPRRSRSQSPIRPIQSTVRRQKKPFHPLE